MFIELIDNKAIELVGMVIELNVMAIEHYFNIHGGSGVSPSY